MSVIGRLLFLLSYGIFLKYWQRVRVSNPVNPFGFYWLATSCITILPTLRSRRSMAHLRPVFSSLVLAAGFEPAASGFGIRCSFLLSYASVPFILPSKRWRPVPESNRHCRSCNPVRRHSANRPWA